MTTAASFLIHPDCEKEEEEVREEEKPRCNHK